MRLEPPLEKYVSGAKPSHTIRPKLHEHIGFLRKEETTKVLTEAGYLTEDGKVSKKAQLDGLVDTCDGKALWNLKKTKKALLELTRQESKPKASPKPLAPQKQERNEREIWTDLENIGTYFGVGKNKVGTWLEQLGLRGYKPRQVNESGDLDMIDIANEAKEKFRQKIPTEKAIELGYAQVQVVEYKQKGKEKSFEKYSWNLGLVKSVLVKAGHELDTERKLLHKGKGKNSDVKVESLDARAESLYREWQQLHEKPGNRRGSFEIFARKPKPLLQRVEMLMGRPRYLIDEQWKKEFKK